MGIRDTIRTLTRGKEYRLGIPNAGGNLLFTEMQNPPQWGYQSYLKAYGEIGTLFACVNVIAQATAKVIWRLYELDKDGEREEVTQHELIDLLNTINPFQSRYQFVYMATLYKLLVGESFWVMNFNGKKQPAEIWLAPPQFMSVVPHPTNYISHYEFRRSGMAKPIPFTVEEIIHIKSPNPFNEYRGISPAQALTIDLDSERYAQRYQQKFFFNDATPGLIMEYPAENLPPSEIRKELVQEWEERHRGFRNRGKVAFSWGAKANVITMSMKDMDFGALRKFNRDVIMAAYHIPPSKLGIVENVNRATALTGDYDFQNNCVHPELCELRESLNKELIPFFGDNLYLDFDNPVPEDETQTINNASNLFKSRIITRNEARELVNMEPLTTPDGEEFATEPTPFGQVPSKEPINEAEPQKAKVKAILQTEPEREDYWKEYVSRAESYEAKFIHELQTMFLEQKQIALDNLDSSKDRNAILVDRKIMKQEYTKRANTVLNQVMVGAIKNGRELLSPPNPHKDGGEIPQVLSQAALKWLKTRIGWAADQIGEETATRLAQILADGYEQGLSIPQIADAIKSEFTFFSDIRAERIARTEIMQASAQGTIEGYKELGEDVISKVQFYTALDERTCDDCNSLHNEIFSLDDSVGVITVHVNCRCVWLPVIE